MSRKRMCITIKSEWISTVCDKKGSCMLPSPLWQIIAPKTRATGFASDMAMLKVQDFQKKIGIIYRLKQICCFTILNSSFEFSQIFWKFLTVRHWLSWLPVNEELRRFQKFKFKIVIWHIFSSPIKFSVKRRPLEGNVMLY